MRRMYSKKQIESIAEVVAKSLPSKLPEMEFHKIQIESDATDVTIDLAEEANQLDCACFMILRSGSAGVDTSLNVYTHCLCNIVSQDEMHCVNDLNYEASDDGFPDDWVLNILLGADQNYVEFNGEDSGNSLLIITINNVAYILSWDNN